MQSGYKSVKKADDFVVLGLLGKGTSGKVYRVRRTQDGKEYALKIMKMREMSAVEREAAANEVRVLASFNHSGVIKYYDSFIENQKLYIVTELASRGDIREEISSRGQRHRLFDEDTIWNYFIQLCDAIAALHRQNIVHRDLKTSNIFLASHTKVKIGDLGVSKIIEHGGLARTIVGTPYYLSPEVWKRKAYDTKSDVWSLGATLYELTTLQHPFDGYDLKSLSANVLKGVYKRIPSHYSHDLSHMISRLLDLNPQTRPSLEEILAMPSVLKRRHLLHRNDAAPAATSQDADFELQKTIALRGNNQLRPAMLPKSNYSCDKPQRSKKRAPAKRSGLGGKASRGSSRSRASSKASSSSNPHRTSKETDTNNEDAAVNRPDKGKGRPPMHPTGNRRAPLRTVETQNTRDSAVPRLPKLKTGQHHRESSDSQPISSRRSKGSSQATAGSTSAQVNQQYSHYHHSGNTASGSGVRSRVRVVDRIAGDHSVYSNSNDQSRHPAHTRLSTGAQPVYRRRNNPIISSLR